jgi:glutaredoxin
MKVRLFTTPNCPFSKKTREFLREHDIEFEDNNVLEDEKASEEMIKVSQQTAVPVILVQNKETVIIRGYDEKRLKEVLRIEVN